MKCPFSGISFGECPFYQKARTLKGEADCANDCPIMLLAQGLSQIAGTIETRS